jgi:hypothetical protein
VGVRTAGLRTPRRQNRSKVPRRAASETKKGGEGEWMGKMTAAQQERNDGNIPIRLNA